MDTLCASAIRVAFDAAKHDWAVLYNEDGSEKANPDRTELTNLHRQVEQGDTRLVANAYRRAWIRLWDGEQVVNFYS